MRELYFLLDLCVYIRSYPGSGYERKDFNWGI